VLVALDISDGIALGAGIVAMLSLIAAVLSVRVSRRANTLSKESNVIAREALDHTARQTALAESAETERVRQQQARAKVRAELSPLFVTAQASLMNFRPVVRVSNVGERDSGSAIVRVYMSPGQSRDLMAWDDEHNKTDRARPIADPEVKFYDSKGAELPAQYLERVVENITPTMPVEFRVILPVAIPPEGQGRYRLPVRVTVRAAYANEPFEWTDYVQTEYGPAS